MERSLVQIRVPLFCLLPFTTCVCTAGTVIFLLQKDKRDYARGSVQLRVDGVLENFDQPLLKFTQAMLSLKQNPLPDNIKVSTVASYLLVCCVCVYMHVHLYNTDDAYS